MRRKPLFPPPEEVKSKKRLRNQGRQEYSVLTLNGRICPKRIRWHGPATGSGTVIDGYLDRAGDEGAGEGDESVEALDGPFEAGDGAAVAVEPGEGAFDVPAASVATHFAAVVGRCGGAVLAVRGDEVDAPLGERRAEGSES